MSKRVFGSFDGEKRVKLMIFLGGLLCYAMHTPKDISIKNTYTNKLMETLTGMIS